MAPVAIVAAEAARRTKPSNYPELFFSRMTKREKRPLGDLFGLKNFGVNLARPGEARLRRQWKFAHKDGGRTECVYALRKRLSP
jgi:uncharacterized cupin superfamily protein